MSVVDGPARPERALAGYDVVETIGRGAHGVVVRARQRSVGDREVAIKRLARGTPGAEERLVQEISILTALDHPHIVQIIDVIEDVDGIAIVMPIAAGGSLAGLLALGALRDAEVAALGARLADALASAHRRGVLHLDVKPDNVLLTADGEPLLADFGVARWAGVEGAVVGTAGFAAPEAFAASSDARTDIYALGQLCRAAMRDDAGDELVAIVDRATAAAPSDRFDDAASFGAALRSVAGELATPAHPSFGSSTTRTRTFGPRPPAHPVGVERTRARVSSRALAAGVAAVIAALLWAGPWRNAARPDVAAPIDRRPTCASTAQLAIQAGASRLTGDLTGTGCSADVVWSATLAEVRVPSDDGEVRYSLGSPGDVLMLGDWDCDSDDTPGLYRPSTGEVFLFNAWAAADAPLPSTRPQRTGKLGGTPHVATSRGCDTLVVDPGSPA